MIHHRFFLLFFLFLFFLLLLLLLLLFLLFNPFKLFKFFNLHPRTGARPLHIHSNPRIHNSRLLRNLIFFFVSFYSYSFISHFYFFFISLSPCMDGLPNEAGTHNTNPPPLYLTSLYSLYILFIKSFYYLRFSTPTVIYYLNIKYLLSMFIIVKLLKFSIKNFYLHLVLCDI